LLRARPVWQVLLPGCRPPRGDRDRRDGPPGARRDGGGYRDGGRGFGDRPREGGFGRGGGGDKVRAIATHVAPGAAPWVTGCNMRPRCSTLGNRVQHALSAEPVSWVERLTLRRSESRLKYWPYLKLAMGTASPAWSIPASCGRGCSTHAGC